MKKCVSCGRELPDEASFCPYCEASQTEPRKAHEPKIWRKKTGIAIISAAALLIIGLALYLILRPRVFNSEGAELEYKGYHVLVTFRGAQFTPAQELAENTIPSHGEYAFPAQLKAYKNNDTENARDEFMELVASAEIEVFPRDGAKEMEVNGPAPNDNFKYAVLQADIHYTTACGTNDIVWTVNMKNGDRLVLRQRIAVYQTPEASYYSSDYDMSDIDALRALLEEIEGSVSEDTLVSIYLPPVVYDGGLTIGNRSYFFYGSTDGENTTTFTDTVKIETEDPDVTEFYGVRFLGNGGSGIIASRSCTLRECVFEGWDKAAVAEDGAWIGAHSCSFINNGVALQFNTHTSTIDTKSIDYCVFKDNRVAVHFVNLPEKVNAMEFGGTTFSGNGQDILNDTAILINTDGAIFE